ncbi:MAG: hypothetical protein JKX79_09690 [Labilibaculum sp.]|nr:hypothetical protein [Labilibaculum sp.]
MKAIGNIHLIWRKGKGSRRFSVGIIKRNATEGIRFHYNQAEVVEAQRFGFTAYEGFPDFSKVYSENVIEIFGQRIVKTERNDISNFLDFWLIDRKYINDKYYMLAYTQGLLPTDNYEFLADFKPVQSLSFVTEVTGLSKIQVASKCLKMDSTLHYELESDNPYDNLAVKVFTEDKYLGHIKKIHSRVFYGAKKTLNISVHNIEKNGVLKRVFVKVTL